MRGEFHAWRRAVVLAAVGLIVAAGTAEANAPLTRVSSDPYTNPTSQHATELEPDTFAHHGTVVSAFQVGRFFNGGASDIGVVRSGDGGATWNAPGFLHDTFNSGNASSPYERVSDASVAYDAAHGVWIVSSIPILPNRSRADRPVQPLDRRRPQLGARDQHAAARLELGQSRQELDGVRQPPVEPVLRPLLHRARQLRRWVTWS